MHDNFECSILDIDAVTSSEASPWDIRKHSPFKSPGVVVTQMPKIRIFGRTTDGTPVLAHVHGFLPYFYIPYTKSLDPYVVNETILSIGKQLNALVHVPSASEAVEIPFISLCKGIDFYGFHVGWSFFLKVHANSSDTRFRAVRAVREGRLGYSCEVFEDHASHVLQFLIDYNLYGCSHLLASHVLYRSPTDDPLKQSSLGSTRMSQGCIEVDISAEFIHNASQVRERSLQSGLEIMQLADPGHSAPHFIEAKAAMPSLKAMWQYEREYRLARDDFDPVIGPTRDVLTSKRAWESVKPQWASEDTYREQLGHRLRDHVHRLSSTRRRYLERQHNETRKTDALYTGLSRNVGQVEWEPFVRTCFVQLTSLNATQISLDKSDGYPYGNWAVLALGKAHIPPPAVSVYPYGARPHGRMKTEPVKEDTHVTVRRHANSEGDHVEPPDVPYVSPLASPHTQSDADLSQTDNELTEDKTQVETWGGSVPPELQSSFIGLSRVNPYFSQAHMSDSSVIVPESRKDSSVIVPENRKDSSVIVPEGRRDSSVIVPESRKDSSVIVPENRKDSSVIAPQSNSSKVSFMEDQNGMTEQGSGVLSDTGSYVMLSSSQVSSLDGARRKSTQSGDSDKIYISNDLDASSDAKSSQKTDRSASLVEVKGSAFAKRCRSSRAFTLRKEAPSRQVVEQALHSQLEIPWVQNRTLHYSNPDDYPEWHPEGPKPVTHEFLPPFRRRIDSSPLSELTDFVPMKRSAVWEIRRRPPTRKMLEDGNFFGKDEEEKRNLPPSSTSKSRERHGMSLLSVEVHVRTRGFYEADPSKDAIDAIVFYLQTHQGDLEAGILCSRSQACDKSQLRAKNPFIIPDNVTAENYASELDLLERFAYLVVHVWDPDIVCAYKVQRASWGYIVERAAWQYGIDMIARLSRVSVNDAGGMASAEDDMWGYRKGSTLYLTGRHVLPVWRALKDEDGLLQNSLDHVVHVKLGIRLPSYSAASMTSMFDDQAGFYVLMAYKMELARINLKLLAQMELVYHTVEFAKLSGVDFRAVRTRGSQFKIESMMMRLGKPENFVFLSPSREGVGAQNAAAAVPLIMEPMTNVYTDPVIVLDFQSLYPSIMIAYNYCYSTCLGRVSSFKGTMKLGVRPDFLVDPDLVEKLKDDVWISPNGMIFVKQHVRTGLLARMLSEWLDTRVMVKKSMKKVDEEQLLRVLNARQLGLKYLLNVTYGYTSASFSGRMPCVEIADAIVQSGRETLMRAIETIESRADWGAKVVYGDTDSLFVQVKGRSKEDAIALGHVMADEITNMNPKPVMLKYEKVYMPSVLLAKKRYVGNKYESPGDTPTFDAKGIETVRRDGVVAGQKLMEECLSILFKTQDVSLVKAHCIKTWTEILKGNVSPREFAYAKAVRLGTYSSRGHPPPGVATVLRRMEQDVRSEPEYGERIPYVLTVSTGKDLLVDKAMSPLDFLRDPRNRLDAQHYIEKTMIAPLDRIFAPVGVNVMAWYRDMAKPKELAVPARPSNMRFIEDHFQKRFCFLCKTNVATAGVLCSRCHASAEARMRLLTMQRDAATAHATTVNTCKRCAGGVHGLECVSMDCPGLYSRARSDMDVAVVTQVLENLDHVEQR